MKFIFTVLITGLVVMPVFGQSKAEISQVLDMMQKQGTFTKEQIDAVKAQVNAMSDEELKAISDVAKEKMKDPKIRAEAEKLMKGKK